MKMLPMMSPLHNSIGPFVKLKAAGVRTYLGIDNIADLFMPVVDGDMWTEARMLMESCRYYDLEQVADWATEPPLHVLNDKQNEGPAAKRARKGGLEEEEQDDQACGMNETLQQVASVMRG